MTTITATTSYTRLPAWAVLQRHLFDLLDAAVDPFLAKYTAADGTLIWRDAASEGYPSRDGADDFYESFGNWPLYYLLGGGDRLLPLSHRQWDAVIRAPHNGAGGPRWGFFLNEPSYGWSSGMARYGLPYHDVPGIACYDDLRDPALARRMGAAMEERMGRRRGRQPVRHQPGDQRVPAHRRRSLP